MYSDNKSVQILVSLLKEYKITLAVLSPGTRNSPLVRSLEFDHHFKCYSIVDERSAAYFALGISLDKSVPVLLSCTSGTASANYFSAICEASKNNIPLVAITSDRHPYLLHQKEDQMITQPNMYGDACRVSVSLPIIHDSNDEWYCRRLLSEALLALTYKGGGPVHINIPIEWGIFDSNYTCEFCHLFLQYIESLLLN